VTLTSSLFPHYLLSLFSPMYKLVYPPNPDSNSFKDPSHSLPVWRIPFEASRRKQCYEFILANIKNIAELDKTNQPLSGEKRELEEETEKEIESDWIPPYCITLKKIKIENPRGNFW
jgi:hypothetical protein